MEITAKKLEIITATAKIINASGVAGLTIKNIAAEMGLTEGALYRHFKSKDEIILTLLEFLASSIDLRFKETTSEHPPNPEEHFTRMLTQQIAYFKANPPFTLVVFSDGLLGANKQINIAHLGITELMSKHLSQVIREGQHKRIFTHTVSTEDLVNIVIGAYKQHMIKWRIADFQYDINKSGNKLIQSLLSLIKTH